MTRTARAANVIGAVLVAWTGVACSARHVPQQVQVEDVASNPGAVTSSEPLEVQLALTADKRVDASNINVDSDPVTRTVTLKGTVKTIDQKALAGQIAVARAAGYQVRNQLRISQ